MRIACCSVVYEIKWAFMEKSFWIVFKIQGRNHRIVDGIKTFCFLLILLGLSSKTSAEQVKVERKFDFNIPQQTVSAALIEFAEQADLTLVFPDELVQGKSANAVIGRFTLQEGVEILLAGTELNPKFSKRNILSILKEEKTTNKKVKLGLFPSIFSAFSGGVNAQDSSVGALEQDAFTVEEIIVTAFKRGEQVLLDVPASVSVFSGDELADTGSYNLQDFLQMAPGITIQNNGLSNQAQIRGVASVLGTSTVGYYIDESPFAFVGSNITPDSRAFDLERMEVLRGPQGTLYGQGSVAGVIRMITKNPSLNDTEFVADISGSSTEDGGNNQLYNVAFGVPLIEDKVAIRVTGISEDLAGWVDGQPGESFDFFGQPTNNFSGQDLNDQQHKSLRIKLLALTSERSTLTAQYWDSDTDFGNPDQSFEDRTATIPIKNPVSNKYKYAYVNYEYEFDNFNFMSNTSYTDAAVSNHGEFFGTDIFTLTDNKGWTQEMRFSSAGDGPFQWIVGGMYQKLDSNLLQDLDQRINDAFGFPDAVQSDDTTNSAVFADGTYTFNDQWDVSIGGRYFKDERATIDLSGATPADPNVQKFSDFSPRLNVAFHPNDRSTIWFQAAKGFRSGLNQFPVTFFLAEPFGIDVPAGAEEEDLWTYELGYKSEFNDGKVLLEAAVFHNEWDNLQQSAPVILQTLNAILNAGSATSTGAELGLTFKPNERLSVGGNVSWNDSKYGEDVSVSAIDIATGDTVPVLVFPKDQRLANVPEWTASLWADYRWPLEFGNGAWEGYFHADAQYRDVITNADGAGGSLLSDDSLVTRARIGIDNETWGVFLYANNLFDEDSAFTPANPEFSIQATRLRPRTIGLNVKYRL